MTFDPLGEHEQSPVTEPMFIVTMIKGAYVAMDQDEYFSKSHFRDSGLMPKLAELPEKYARSVAIRFNRIAGEMSREIANAQHYARRQRESELAVVIQKMKNGEAP